MQDCIYAVTILMESSSIFTKSMVPWKYPSCKTIAVMFTFGTLRIIAWCGAIERRIV
jgi:hypothetical protein